MYVQYSDNPFVGPCLTLGIKPGKYDDDLKWPLTGKITLILLHPTDPQKNKELKYQIKNVPKTSVYAQKIKYIFKPV